MNKNENNFDALRRLLELKRHETPPPGYFNRFSGQVIARIRAGEARKSSSKTSWFVKFLQAFEFKPAFAGAFASALLLMLVFGIAFAERPDSSLQPLLSNSEQSSGSFAAMTPAALPQPTDSIGMIVSNNAVSSLQPVASLFGQQNPFAQQVSFTTSGN
ncbi:MAG TPA: hypothetical protein VHY30_08460 [Verrucomicrobiae bacterium]|jgi:hypothetical protein|nr:hypothetical protein [Verrucomicrobiae bacterium]